MAGWVITDPGQPNQTFPANFMHRIAAPLFLLYLLTICQPVYAAFINADSTSTQKPNFRVGLALSGGGATGLAHIGVLKVLEEVGMPIDVVAGTSMGAIVGALYAVGYDHHQIDEIVRTTDWRQLIQGSVNREYLPMEEKEYDGRFFLNFPIKNGELQLPTGLISGNQTFNLLARLTWLFHNTEDFRTLPRPFLCIATDLETGEQVILDRGFLPDALRASMSIPSVFDPIKIDGRYLVDGGLVNNMPVEETFDLGADFVIAINSSSDLKPAENLISLPDILNQTVTISIRPAMMRQRDKADYYIQPDLKNYTTMSFGDVDEIIQAGENAARERIDEIRALADSLNQLRGFTDKSDIPDYQSTSYLNIRNIRFEGLETVPEDHIRSKLQIKDNSVIHADKLNHGLQSLYGMNRFSKVTYRLTWMEDAVDLTIYVEEQTANTFQAGIHHNSTTGPAILFNTTFRNLLYPASTARINVRAGYEAMTEVQYFNYIGIEPRLTFNGTAGFREREIDIFEGTRRTSNLRTDMLYGEGLIGPLFSSVFRAEIGYRYEYFDLTESYGELAIPVDWNSQHLFVGEMEFDNLNRSHIPTSGHHVEVRAELAPKFIRIDSNFKRLHFEWDAYYPVTDRLTLLKQIRGGYLLDGSPPLHYRFYAGGHEHFWGYRKDELAGNNLLTVRLASQYSFYRNLYFAPGINVGDSYDQLDKSLFDNYPKWGWAGVLSWKTVIGPVEVVIMGSKDYPLLYEFRMGLSF